ncbi:MAG: energy-coupling factor transporter transmembrane protein EcfT, partial [Treponema sp.]|nr:energy-coupling factor transporter transmembrane protein EcfT [Treponema sp.]
MNLTSNIAGGVLFRLHTGVKVIIMLIYSVTVVSFDRYAVGRLMPFLLYLVLLWSSMDFLLSVNIRRLLPALPFCAFAGLSDLLFERETAFTVVDTAVSYGVISCCSLILRAVLCVEALMLLVETQIVKNFTTVKKD